MGLWILLGFIALSLVGQAVPLYTDWLWFQEVGFTSVFTTRLTLSGWLFLGLGAVVFVFLFVNLSVAARTAPPDVLWELEDQLGLPGRAILEPLVRRLLLPVIAVISFFAGARATSAWSTVLEYVNRTPFGQSDPLFGRDLGFYVFVLPFWRLLHGWGTALVAGTLVLVAAVYVLQRSLVLTARGPRLAAGARTHLLGLAALLLVLNGRIAGISAYTVSRTSECANRNVPGQPSTSTIRRAVIASSTSSSIAASGLSRTRAITATRNSAGKHEATERSDCVDGASAMTRRSITSRTPLGMPPAPA